jgi:hypothetical protein
MITISRLYDDYSDASRAVAELERAGIPHSDISIIANNVEGWYGRDRTSGRIDRDHDGVDDRVEGAVAGAGIGATAAGVAGLLAGLGLLAIPGLGPVVAAGWLASMALGAAVGGTVGGVIGALTQSGVSEEDAHVYAEGVRRAGTLVTARVPDSDRQRCEVILDRSAVNIRNRAQMYQEAGWSRFDPKAPPYTPEQVRRERELYRERF